MKDNEQGPMENLWDGLSEHADSVTLDELREEAAARGIDLDRALAAMKELIVAGTREERLGWMKIADQRKESLRVSEKGSKDYWRAKSPREVFAAFEAFLNSAPAETALAFRNKGNLSTSDMIQILEANEQLKRRSDSKD
jgi:hypothetical protein